MDERWREAAESLYCSISSDDDDSLEGISSSIIPADLKGSEISLHRGLREDTSGCWLIWTERGPILCRRVRFAGRRIRWVLSADAALGECYPEGVEKLREWIRSEEPLSGDFLTRREALSVLQAALARSSGRA